MARVTPFKVTIALPTSDAEFGRWLEGNNVSIEVASSLGKYCVVLTRKKLISSSDDHGQHYEEWRVSRYDKDFLRALTGAMTEVDSQLATEAHAPKDQSP